MYESLVQIHPETEEFIPCIASHWKIETDEEAETQTFTFRIDPRVRWADGDEFTAADVYYSWWHRVQRDRQDPSNQMTFSEGYEEPEILDKYTDPRQDEEAQLAPLPLLRRHGRSTRRSPSTSPATSTSRSTTGSSGRAPAPTS